MKKRALGMTVALVLLLQSISIPIVNADGIFFPGCEQVISTKVTKGEWGTLGMKDIKFNNNDQDSTDPAKSVFNEFKFYRGMEFWHKDKVCDKNGNLKNEKDRQDINFLYNWWNGNYPDICFDNLHAKFIGVYNPNNNKRNFDVDFGACLDADLQALVEKGDLQIMIMADTRNFDNGKDYETGIASIRFYGSGSPILKQVSTSEYEYRKGKTGNDTETAINKSSGWHTFPKGCTRILAYLQSSGGNEKGKQNRAAVTNVRVYLKDGGKPNVTSVGLINDGTWSNYTSNAGKKGQGKIIGDTVRYWVTFGEKVEVKGTPQLQLDAGKGYTGLKATYADGSGTNTLYFDYKIQDMTNSDNNINTFGKAVKIAYPADAAITDLAGNLYSAGTDITSYFMNKILTIDDTITLIHKTNYEDTVNGTFYPKRTAYYGSNTWRYAVGERPLELKEPVITGGSGDQYNQPVMFGFTNEECPIFRVLLNEEIQINSLNTKNTKLKLQVYDKDKNVTADLVGARIMNVNNTVANGINTGQTELLFRYKPKKEDFDGLSGEVFYLDFKGQLNEKNEFAFADDIILNETNPLYNISGMKVINSKLVLPPKNGTKRTPLNKMIGIDLEGPVLEKKNIDTKFKKQLDDSSYLIFKDKGSGISTNGANISICYYDEENIKRKAIIRHGNNSGENLTLPCWNGKVSLSGISIEPNQTINYPLYLEYEIWDRAGNVATNKNGKNIEIKIDTTSPTVNGAKVTVDGNKAKAAYDVSDKGVGEISPEFYYKVETGVSGQVPISNPLSGQSSKQEVEITGVQGSKETYRVWANFSDTVGNWMKSYFPTDPIDIATRVFSLSLDSLKGRMAKDHYIKIRGDKIPDKDFIIKLYYKWVPSGKSEAAVQQYDMVEYRPEDFKDGVKPFCLSTNEIQKKWMKAYTGEETLFDGEVKFIGRAEMWTTSGGEIIRKEAVQENISDVFYFDIAPPTFGVEIKGENSGYNSDYRVQFSIRDYGAEYHNGIYDLNGHFDFKNNPPTYEIILGSESLGPKPLNYLNGEFDIPFGSQFRNNEKYKDITEAFIRFNATDRFGNTASEIFGPIKVDFQAPEIIEFVPLFKSGMVEGIDYVKYGEGSDVIYEGYMKSYDDVYIVRNLGDVLDAIKITETDNVLDGIYARYRQGVKLVEARYPEESNSHTFTIDNLTYQSFDISSFRAMDSYEYGVELLDMAGNSCSSSIRFIEDDNPPVITYAKRPEGESLTNASSADIDVLYSCDAYETIDDLKFEIQGKATINTEKSRHGNLVLTATDNGDINVKITDRLGNFAQKTINVNCFDIVPPEAKFISQIGYPERPSKCGELVFEVSDDRKIGNVSIAITKSVPTEDDYFNKELPNNEDFPNGYFGVESEHAYASLGQLHDNLSADDKDVRRYKLSYYALPNGNYDVYTKIIDAAGNVIEDRIGEIYCSSEPVSVTSMEYSPSSATGGSVRVDIKTDSPSYIKELAYLSEDSKSSGNVGIMQASVKKARKEGYSYNWEGERKVLETFSELNGRYNSINKESPTDEDQYVYKYVYSEVYSDSSEYRRLYENFLFDDTLVEPVGDMVDFMMNQALYSSRYEIGNWNEDDAPVINMTYDTGDPGVDMKDDIITPLTDAGILTWWSDKWDDPIPSLQNATDLRLYYGKRESPTIDVLAYPQPFDNYVINDGVFEKDDEDSYKIFEKDDKGEYMNFAMANDGKIINPFIEGGKSLTEEEIIGAFRAIKLMQPLRAKTINAVADKYVKAYAKLSDMGTSMSHLLTFDYNVDKNYTLVDLSGQEREFNIKIDNIDPSIPHIPKEQIWLEDEDGNKVLSYTNGERAKLVIDNENPIHDIYKEYYIFDVEGGTVSGKAVDNYQGKPLYKRVEVTVNDNTEVSFKIINPTMLGVESKTAIGVRTINEDLGEPEPSGEEETATEDEISTEDLSELEPSVDEETPVEEETPREDSNEPELPGEEETLIDEEVYTDDSSTQGLQDGEEMRIEEEILMEEPRDLEPPIEEETSINQEVSTDDPSGREPQDEEEMGIDGETSAEEEIPKEEPSEEETVMEEETVAEEQMENRAMELQQEFNDGKIAIGDQSYKITQFDRTPPTARLVYSPARKPGDYVNTDVTVTLTDIEDDKSTLTGIKTNMTEYTFTKNGDFDFVITDEAGNKETLTATVDYIDKTPVKLTAKFYKQNGELIPASAFTYHYDDTDNTNTESTYVYEGVYLKDPIQAVIFDKTIEITEFTIDTDTIDTSYEHVGKSGNKGTIYIKGLKFDTSPPTASDVSYVYTKASDAGVNESDITAKFTLSDNVVKTLNKEDHLVNITGADEKGNAFTKDHVIFNDNEVSVKFNYNGSARLTFCDDANNLLRVDLKVENLDKTPPRAYIEYSKTTATNKDVTATIFLSEPADYKVMDINNTVLKDYSNSYSGYPINYVFAENKSLFFVFRDADGNLSKTYVATVTNIDKTSPELDYEILYKKALTTSDEPTLIDFTGAVTIEFSVKDKSSGDRFTGGLEEDDTIFITNRGNSVYHTVMDNGNYSFMYSDLAGNVETIIVPVTGIDKTPPTATITGNPTTWTNEPVDITITPKDDEGQAFVVLNGTRHDSYTFTVKQNSEYRFVIEDESRNSAIKEVKVEYVDTTPPTISYTGYKDIFVKVGEFVGDVKSDFENVTLSDAESGLASDIPIINYPAGFDPNKPGEYNVTFNATDNAGNTATFVRKIKVLGETDIIIVINDTEVIPNSQVEFPLGELTLSVFNAEKTGSEISYAFEPGFFNPAEMKGTSYKKTMPSNGKATLNPQEPGLYTLLIQTEDRQTIVSYVFITGILNKGGGEVK